MLFHPVSRDRNYTIGHEYTGHASGKPQWVIRYCGEFISAHQFRSSAAMRAVGHHQQRIGAPIITAIEA